MADYYTIITDTGKAKLAAAIASQQTIKLTHLAIGDGGGAVYDPVAKQNALNNERARVYLSNLLTTGNNLTVEAIIPSDVGGFYIREVGIYDSDNVLFAIGKVPETYKPKTGNGLSQQISLRLFFVVADAEGVIALAVDPDATLPTKAYVDTAIDGAKAAVVEQVAAKLPLAGGTLAGHLTLNYSHPAVLLRPSSNPSGTGCIVWEGTPETLTRWDIRRTNIYEHFQIAAINPTNSQDYCRFTFYKDGTLVSTKETNSADPKSFVKKNYVDSLFYPQNGAATYVSNTLTLDCAKGQVFEYTLTANTGISIINKPTNLNHMIMLKLTKGGNYMVTHPTGCKFVGGNKTLTTNGLDYIFYYLDSAGGVVANIVRDIK